VRRHRKVSVPFVVGTVDISLLGQGPVTETAVIRDVTEATFASQVIEASRTRPVVVDFWAPWCGPCRQLSPLLERAANRWATQIDVVKVNIDQAPITARQLRIQSIPAVKAFVDGRIVAEFLGVQPETAVERFFAALAPSEADRLVAQAQRLAPAEAESLLRQALATRNDHPAASRALARLLLDRGHDSAADRAEAIALLERLPGDAEAIRMLAHVRLSDAAVNDDTIAQLRVQAQGGDVQSRLAFGRALAAREAHREALEALITAAGDPKTREDAREAVLEVFRVLGDDHELVRTFRPRLASVLY
jgi:putative thioredoxin